MTQVRHTVLITAEQAGRRLDQALAELLPEYSRSRLKEWIVAGSVRLDGAVAEPRSRVTEGQQVEVDAAVIADFHVAAQPIGLDIVHQDSAVLVLNKPAGLVVHPGAGNPDATLENGLRHFDPSLAELPRSGILHRLDKDTSGLLLVARTLEAHTQLTRDLQEREIRREYRALVNGVMTAGGTVEAPIDRHATQRTRMAVVHGGRPAVTHYRVLARGAAHTWLAVRLETGRTHQIRVHMTHIGFPIVGDPLYGGRPRVPAGASATVLESLRSFRRQALHASAIAFTHPVTGESLEFTAALPADLRSLLEVLAGSAAAAARAEAMPWPGNPV